MIKQDDKSRLKSIHQKNEDQFLMQWLFVFIMTASIPPFFFWNISAIVYVLSSLGFFLYGLWEKPKNEYWRISIFLFILFYSYASFNLYDGLNLTGKIWNGYRLFISFAIFFISRENWTEIYKKFLLVYTLTLIPSLLVYFSAIWGGLNLSHTFIPPLNELKDHGYIAYPFMVISEGLDNFRFCGYYDEPGVIGTVSGVLLIVNQCQMRDWKNWILLISGVFSFSLFFYILLSLYVLFFGSMKMKIALVIFTAVVIAYLANSDNVFSNLILARLQMGDDGMLVGDNRTKAAFDHFYDKFLHSDKLWFGYGHLYCSKVADIGGQSYKHIIVDHGIIMSILYVVAFVFYYLSYNLKKKQLFFVLMILLSVLYQRPFITYLLYLFLMISPVAMVKTTFESSISTKNTK